MQLVQAREGQTQQPIESVFTPEQVVVLEKLNPTLEGRTEKLKNPHKKHPSFCSMDNCTIRGMEWLSKTKTAGTYHNEERLD